MYDREDVPKVSPPTVFALFADLQTARIALEALLQGGFHAEQLGWLRADDSVLSAADLATYRATGLSESPSRIDAPAASDRDEDPAQRNQSQLAQLRENSIVISVAPGEHQEKHAREMLTALGGKLLRPDGSLGSEEAA